MKKAVIALAAAIVINLAGTYINYRSFIDTNYLKLSFKIYGGEFMGEFGFWLRASHHYAMSSDGRNSHSITFSPISFIVFTLITFAAAYAVTWIIFKIKAKRRCSK